MKRYDEKNLESFIEAHLLENGYQKRESKDYDKDFCVDREILFGFLRATQKDELDELQKRTRRGCEIELLEKLDKSIQEKGLCAVLKNGVSVLGVNFSLLYRKNDDKKNEILVQRYESNTLSVARQVHFSKQTNESVDMVVFVNGIATISIELKNKLTNQSVQDAIRQYKFNRSVREKLFNSGRCVVHFALDNDAVFMTTRLNGKESEFLPFNRGLNDGSGEFWREMGAGNPPQENKMKSAYFWERILAKDTLIKILLDFVQGSIAKNGRVIFPRYHQFDLVDKLLKECVQKGVGQRYLIQHSAGSGKSNSISYLAHQLVGLRDKNDELVFDSIIVVTDRRVLDNQINANIQSFEHTKGVIEHADSSKNLREALESGKKIIISTIQKFPFVVEQISALKSKKFAIIIDEAHSSQSGASAAKMGEAISKDEKKENKEDKEKIESYEDMQERIIAAIKAKKLQANASYFAFTATPKPTTLEMFGREVEFSGERKFVPFHLYSMKQAIEEGYILNVVENYTTYKSYYQIIKTISENPSYDKKKANAKLRRYVEGNKETIKQKTQVMIEHFAKCCAHKINGKAKAMVVTRSRKDALCYYFAFKECLKELNLPFKALIAFSGELNDDGQIYTESQLNGFNENSLTKEFKKDEYRFLIVAEKYQTGFDEPLLHTMYVDKKLSGINAVQTLSRLNRKARGKNDTCVLDFANDEQDIAKAFSTFYEATYLKEASDINKIFDLCVALLSLEIYTQEQANDFLQACLNGENENAINARLDEAVKKFSALEQESKEDFYQKAKNFVREYEFLSLILPFEDINLEANSLWLRHLIKKLPAFSDEILPKEFLESIDLQSYRLERQGKATITLQGKGELAPSVADGSKKAESKKEPLDEIVREFNERFGALEWGDNDKLKHDVEQISNEILGDEEFKRSVTNTDTQTTKHRVEQEFNNKLSNIIDINERLYENLTKDENFKAFFVEKIFEKWLQEKNVS